MPSDLGVFGITPLSTEGVPLAETRIEDMADFYVREVRTKQPRGPYLLGGLCAGGVIAYEMASQLLHSGENVELVALLDAATPQAPKRRQQRFRRLKQALAKASNSEPWAIGQASSVVAIVSLKLVSAINRQGERWWVRARFHLLHQLLARQRPWPRYISRLSSLQIYESAAARYVPKPLSGASVVLVRARHQTPFLNDTPFRAVRRRDVRLECDNARPCFRRRRRRLHDHAPRTFCPIARRSAAALHKRQIRADPRPGRVSRHAPGLVPWSALSPLIVVSMGWARLSSIAIT
jgi:thioesterase domain-containing protein